MNENIDILLSSAKIASRNNPVAHLVTHAVSMTYNASMLWHYNYRLSMTQAVCPGYMSTEQIQAMKQDRRKHSVLLALESIGLIAAGICSLQERE